VDPCCPLPDARRASGCGRTGIGIGELRKMQAIDGHLLILASLASLGVIGAVDNPFSW